MRFLPKKNNQVMAYFGRNSSSEVNFASTAEHIREVTPRGANSISGGVQSSTLPVNPNIPVNPTDSRQFNEPTSDDSTKLWSPSVQALLDQPSSSFPHQLIAGGVIFCLVFMSWACFGTIEEVGKAQGQLVPEGETYKIEPIELGQVRQVFVEEGEEVKAGQVLVELDTELADKEVERLQQIVTAYQIELNQKQSLREKIQLEATTQSAIASAKLLAQQASLDLAKQKTATLQQLLDQQKAEAAAYRLRQIQRQPLVAMAKERLTQLQAEKVAHQQRIDRLRPLKEEGAVSEEYIFQAEQALRDTEQRITFSELQELTDADEQLFQANQAVRQLQAQITQNQGDLLIAAQEVEQAQAELVAQQAEAQRIQLEALQKVQQLDVEISQLQGKIVETKNLLVSAQTKLQSKYLRTPVNGVVLSLDLKNTGEVVDPGQTLAEVAPHGVPLVVSATLPNQEAGFIEPGMPVQVKLDAYPYQDYGVIPGQVTAISADAKSDEKFGEVYRVEIKLEKDHITENQEIIPFKAGQTVSADIIIRHRRIIDVLLDPIKQIQKDGINL